MIIVVAGPTGVGKTKLSIALAKEFNGEVINGDSVQVYRGLDIGSAKIKETEKEGIIHHLFDIKDVWEEYSIYDYQKDARRLIEDITNRGKNVIIVGGTGLYIKSALYDYTLEESNIKDNYDDKTTGELYQELMELDKGAKVDRFNRRRVVRALDYYKANGKSISENSSGNNLLYDALFIGLTTDRETLYERINKRVDEMIEEGLLDEVRSFYDKSYRYKPLLSAIGYKELYQYFDGNMSYEEAIDAIKRDSRRYAKRQFTFFYHQFKMKWFNANFQHFDATINEVINFIKAEKK